jgi:alpha-galactosidase
MKRGTRIIAIFAMIILSSPLRAQEFWKWALTPPMGWNSWDCFGPTVTEEEVKANADYMAAHLKKFGWEYIVVDIRWYVGNDKAHGYNEKNAVINMDDYGRLLPAVNRFPSSANGKGFKPLADYIHSKGLKFGIHIMRGIPKLAVERNTLILGSTERANNIYSTRQLCAWLGDMYTVDASKPGAQEYYNSLFKLYASWGVDFVKVDDISRPYHKDEIDMVRRAIDSCGRPIVLSLSPGETPIEDAENVSTHANMWRIMDDFWDNWSQLEAHFSFFEKWIPYMGPGHWPDGDMLPLGRIGIRAEQGNPRMTMFTKDEQVTLMSLFLICRSPLMFGGNLPDNDQFTLNLITNEEALAVLQKSRNNRLLFDDEDRIAWISDDFGSSDKYVALFYDVDRKPILESNAIWSSRLLTYRPGEQSADMKVIIGGAKKLYLVVTDGGDGNNWDHADWIDPRLTGKKGTLNLTSIKWTSATSGWSTPKVDESVGGNKLTVDNKEYADGIGTHANSIIEYDIPEGYDTLSAMMGLDKECIGHTEGATVKFHVFTENPAGSLPMDSIKIPLNIEQLGLEGKCEVRDLWERKNIGKFSSEISLYVRNHGARLLKISEVK